MKNWLVYILKCNDGTYYTGATNNLENRFNKHSTGKGARYTKFRCPLQIVYVEKNLTKIEALKRERQIKKMTRKGKQDLIKKYAV